VRASLLGAIQTASLAQAPVVYGLTSCLKIGSRAPERASIDQHAGVGELGRATPAVVVDQRALSCGAYIAPISKRSKAVIGILES
jgi:hypothetical protein